jgi:alpha-glucosidase
MDREGIYKASGAYRPGAYDDPESPWRNYFRFHGNKDYEAWWGVETLPKLNYEGSSELCMEIMRVAEKWASPPYSIDGWRLDVGADLGHSREFNHLFWQVFRRRIKQVNPNAVILAEHYGDPADWLRGNEWDTVMNYDAFMEPVTWFLTGMEKHSDEYRHDLLGNIDAFWNAMYYNGAKMTTPSRLISMNELSNHDHSRFLTRPNRKVGRTGHLGPEAANENVSLAVMREAVLVQMTWPGAATLYYGDEAGVCGFTDPDNRRTYPWGHENKQLLHFHKAAIRLRKNRPELRTGSTKRLGGEHNFLCYARFDESHQTITLINNNEYEIEVQVPAWLCGIPKEDTLTCILSSNRDGFTEIPETYKLRAGKLTIKLPGYSGKILVHG